MTIEVSQKCATVYLIQRSTNLYPVLLIRNEPF